MGKFKVVIRSTGQVILDNLSHEDAMRCVAELIAIDKTDGTFTSKYYAVRRELK